MHASLMPPAHLCDRCLPASAGARAQRRLLDLLALLEHPTALPPELALRLGVELIAHTTEGRQLLVCEAAGEIVP